jgi:hypothetical protein
MARESSSGPSFPWRVTGIVLCVMGLSFEALSSDLVVDATTRALFRFSHPEAAELAATDRSAVEPPLVGLWHFNEPKWATGQLDVRDELGTSHGHAIGGANATPAGQFGRAGLFP